MQSKIAICSAAAACVAAALAVLGAATGEAAATPAAAAGEDSARAACHACLWHARAFGRGVGNLADITERYGDTEDSHWQEVLDMVQAERGMAE